MQPRQEKIGNRRNLANLNTSAIDCWKKIQQIMRIILLALYI